MVCSFDACVICFSLIYEIKSETVCYLVHGKTLICVSFPGYKACNKVLMLSWLIDSHWKHQWKGNSIKRNVSFFQVRKMSIMQNLSLSQVGF